MLVLPGPHEMGQGQLSDGKGLFAPGERGGSMRSQNRDVYCKSRHLLINELISKQMKDSSFMQRALAWELG